METSRIKPVLAKFGAYALHRLEGRPHLVYDYIDARVSEATWKAYAYSTAVKRLRKAGVVPADFHAHAMRREFISREIGRAHV